MNTNRKLTLATLSVVAFPVFVFAASPHEPAPTPRTDTLHLSLVHRGGGHKERPDNTLDTFLWCWGNGAAVECDCRRTKDGVGIMLHDSTLKRTARGIPADLAEKKVSEELAWDDIKDADVGSYIKRLNPSAADYSYCRIPTIEATFAAMKGHPDWLCYVDEKGAEPKYIAAKAREAGVVEQVYFTSMHYHKALEWIREVPDGKTLMWIGTWPRPAHDATGAKHFEEYVERHMAKIRAGGYKGVTSVQLHIWYKPGTEEPMIPREQYLRKAIAELHAHGITVMAMPFEGGEKEETYFKLWDIGFDSFGTDFPSVMFSVIRKLRE